MAENDVGNAAAMRAALEKIKKLNRYDLGCIRSRKRREEFDAKILEIERVVRVALDAPARNCDRFATFDEAKAEFDRTHDVLKFSYYELHKWLFAPVEGGDKC